MFKWLITFLFLICAQFAMAHSHDHPFEDEEMIELYQKIIELSPELMDNASQDQSRASLRVYGKRIYTDSNFWLIVRGWLKQYHKEIKKDCHHCHLPEIDDSIEEAKALHAQGMLKSKLWQPIKNSSIHITDETVELGATLGKPAFVAKITSEVAETILSKTVGGAGVHVFCSVIDLAIIFGTRYLQNMYRTPLLAAKHYNSGLLTSLKVGMISSAIRRSQKKVRFEIGPIEINEDDLKKVDQEGPNRYWGWIKSGKRQHWVNKLVRRKKLTLKKKSFLGQRYKRTLFILSRRRNHSQYMNGKQWHDKVLAKPYLWILSVQENILDRSTLNNTSAADVARIKENIDSYSPSQDVLSRHLVNKYYGGQNATASFLLKDIELIFDPKISKRQRYLMVLQLEAAFVGIIHSIEKNILNEALEHGSLPYKQQLKVRWHLGKIANYFYEYTDFLRVSAVQKNSKKLQHYKYQSIEVLFKAFKVMQDFNSLALSGEHLTPEASAQLLEELTSFTPWQPKKQSYSFIPFRTTFPQCKKLVEVVK